MITLKTNKIFLQVEEYEYGDYVNNDGVRFLINDAHEVNAPDDADLSDWKEYESLEQYCKDNNLMYKPIEVDQEVM